MPAAARKKKPDPAAEEEKRQLVDVAIQEGKRLAESRLEMIKLFLSRSQTEVAQRRLKELIELHPGTNEAQEAAELLKGLKKPRKSKA